MPPDIDPSKYIILTRHECGLYILLIAIVTFFIALFCIDQFYRQMIKAEIDEIVKRYNTCLEKFKKGKSK